MKGLCAAPHPRDASTPGRPPERTSAARVHDPPARSARISRSWAAALAGHGPPGSRPGERPAFRSGPRGGRSGSIASNGSTARKSARAESNDASNRHSVPVRRLPVPPSADADVIKFEPTQGVQTFAARQPVLRIKPGDTVESRTFSKPGDYYEKDGGAWPGEVGPFFVEGLRPATRSSSASSKCARTATLPCRTHAPGISAVAPDSRMRMLTDPLPARRFVWTLDRARNMGILVDTQLGVETNRGCTQPDARAPRGRARG